VADPPNRPAGALARIGARRLAVVLAIWIVAAGGAVLVAMGLDDPVGQGARDVAQPVAGDVVLPDPGRPEGLPPLVLVLDRPLPKEIVDLPPAEQVTTLRQELALTASPRRAVELAAVLGGLGQTAAAATAYGDALTLDPDYLPALVGRILNDAARGDAAAKRRAADDLAALEARNPRSQLVAFNRAWLAVYRRDPETARAAWTRAVALGPRTDLGITARRLLDALLDPSRDAARTTP
jgi:tetratricopeptide (TPR) repeat protein